MALDAAIGVTDPTATCAINRTATFSSRDTRYEQRYTNLWRTQLQPIRTFGEITAHIKIQPAYRVPLYQKLTQKATQLRLLGMTYKEIAKSLSVNKKTAIRACKYKNIKRGKITTLEKRDFIN